MNRHWLATVVVGILVLVLATGSQASISDAYAAEPPKPTISKTDLNGVHLVRKQPTVTSTPSATATRTVTATFTATPTKTVTITPSSTLTPTATGTTTATATMTVTATKTPEPTSTWTPTATATVIPTNTATPSPTFTATASATPVQTGGKAKGMTLVTWWNDTYLSGETDQAMIAYRRTNSNWVTVLTTGYQETTISNVVFRDPNRTPSEASLVHIIADARAYGLKVSLKPHVDILGPGWRGEINPTDVDAWFASYETFIVDYARFAEANNVELFEVGTELTLMTRPAYSPRWRAIVAKVREVYHGKITYAANWGDEFRQIDWWDCLDYLGVDAYYPLSVTDNSDLTVEEIMAAWHELRYPWGSDHWFDELKNVSLNYNRQLIFTEWGYCSTNSAARQPWAYDPSTGLNLTLQARLYEAFLRTFGNEPWVYGYFGWAWDAAGNQYGPNDPSFNPRDKPAEGTLSVFNGN